MEWWFLPPLSYLSIHCVLWLLFTSVWILAVGVLVGTLVALLLLDQRHNSPQLLLYEIKSVIAPYRIVLIRIILYFITLVLSLDIVCQKDCIMLFELARISEEYLVEYIVYSGLTVQTNYSQSLTIHLLTELILCPGWRCRSSCHHEETGVGECCDWVCRLMVRVPYICPDLRGIQR